MEEKMSKSALSLSIIALLISLGVPLSGTVLDNELGDYYICSVDNEILEFKGGISGTSYSGYPFEGSRSGAERCGTSSNKGEWVSLSVYAESVGLDPYDLLVEEEVIDTPQVSNAKQFICSSSGCVPA